MDPFPIYYSISQIAERVGFSRNTVDNWYRDGELSRPAPVLRIGDDLRIPWSNVADFLKRHALPGNAEKPVRTRAIKVRVVEDGVRARNAGELRRKLAMQEASEVVR